MGWKAFYRDGRTAEEGIDGRPVQAGEEGQLCLITQEDYHHKIGIDLVNGVIFLGYDRIGMQNGTVEVEGFEAIFSICDETNVVGDLFDLETTIPDADGWFQQTPIALIWRPIWFTRFTSSVGETKVIGAQTTLPEIYGGKNIKKLISLFPDGRIGID